MELSPDLLANVTFQEQWRGYSPDQVHDFLARVGNGVRDLQARLRETEDKLRAADARASDLSDADEIRRTLVLAQRTATAAVEEAQAEAARIVAEAEAAAAEARRSAEAEAGEARRVADDEVATRRHDVETSAAELVSTAEVTAQGIVGAAERRLSELEDEIARRESEELAELTSRTVLEADVDALEAFAADGRARLQAELHAQLEALEVASLGERPTLSPLPELHPSHEPADEVDREPVDDAGDATGEEPGGERADTATHAAVDPSDESAGAEGGDPGAPSPGSEWSAEPAGGAPTTTLFDDERDESDEPDHPPAAPPDEELDWAAPSALSDPVLERTRAELAEALRDAGALLEPLADDRAGGEPTEDEPTEDGRPDDTGEVPAVVAPAAGRSTGSPTRVIADEPDDDPFLSELRRAVTDTEPLGPREHQPTGETPVIDATDGSRFRLRRNR